MRPMRKRAQILDIFTICGRLHNIGLKEMTKQIDRTAVIGIIHTKLTKELRLVIRAKEATRQL
jgi:hypothetical protein